MERLVESNRSNPVKGLQRRAASAHSSIRSSRTHGPIGSCRDRRSRNCRVVAVTVCFSHLTNVALFSEDKSGRQINKKWVEKAESAVKSTEEEEKKESRRREGRTVTVPSAAVLFVVDEPGGGVGCC